MIRLLAVVLSVCVDALVWDLRVQKNKILFGPKTATIATNTPTFIL